MGPSSWSTLASSSTASAAGTVATVPAVANSAPSCSHAKPSAPSASSTSSGASISRVTARRPGERCGGGHAAGPREQLHRAARHGPARGVAEAGLAQPGEQLVGRRQIRRGPRQVAVRVGVVARARGRAAAPRRGTRAALPARSTRARGRRRRAGSTRPPDRVTRAHSASTASRSTKLRSANPHTTPSSDGVAGTGALAVAADQRRVRVGGREHPARRSRRRSAVPGAARSLAQVAGAAREVEHERLRRATRARRRCGGATAGPGRARSPGSSGRSRARPGRTCPRRRAASRRPGGSAVTPVPAAPQSGSARAAASSVGLADALEVLLRDLEQDPPEVVRHQRRHGGQQRAERVDEALAPSRRR